MVSESANQGSRSYPPVGRIKARHRCFAKLNISISWESADPV